MVESNPRNMLDIWSLLVIWYLVIHTPLLVIKSLYYVSTFNKIRSSNVAFFFYIAEIILAIPVLITGMIIFWWWILVDESRDESNSKKYYLEIDNNTYVNKLVLHLKDKQKLKYRWINKSRIEQFNNYFWTRITQPDAFHRSSYQCQ